MELSMKPRTANHHVLGAFRLGILLLAGALPVSAQNTDLGCRTLVAPAATGRPQPTFTDFTPTDPILCILKKMTWTTGIMTGCDVNTFCPNELVTREAMAVYLLNGLYPSTPSAPATPFDAATGVFDDVPADYPLACWIEKLYNIDITAGCGGGKYCPTSPISRAEMAVFLLMAKHGPGYVPPPSTGTLFTDVPIDHWAGDFIEELYWEDITAGCTATLYCPDNTVTRWEMMVFLYATFTPGTC
jgi:hypothetical protein